MKEGATPKNFFKNFIWYADRVHPPYLILQCQNKGSMGERRNQPPRGRASKKAPKVRILLLALMYTWQTWCMRMTENPENVVRVHKCPHITSRYSSVGRTSVSKTESRWFESITRNRYSKCENARVG